MDKKLKVGIITILLANIINTVFSLATNFLLPKYLSIDSYAAIKTFQLYVSYVGLFHLGYVDGMYLKYGGCELGKNVDENFSLNLSTMHFFQLGITIFTVVISLFSRDWIVLLFALSIFPQNISNYYKFLYQATGAFELYGRIMNLSTASTFILNVILLFVLHTDAYLIYIICYVVLYYIIWIILEIYFRKKHTISKAAIFSWKELAVNICDGFLLTLGNLASMLLTSMDRWFVKILLKTIDFAQYSFAVSVESFLNLAVTPVTTTLYNFFCREHKLEKQRQLLKYVLVYATVLPASAFIVQFILERFLDNYIGSSKVIFFLFAAQMFYIIIKSIYVNLYKVRRKQKIYFIKLIIILLLGFIFNVVCYASVHVKESFAVGTLFSAIVWFLISQADFKELGLNCKEYIYLFGEMICFLALGLNLKAINGLLIYMLVTVLMLTFFMHDTLLSILKFAKNKKCKFLRG